MRSSGRAVGPADVAEDAEIARLMARLSMEHFLRTAQGLAAMLRGEDLLTMLIHRAILTANLAHLMSIRRSASSRPWPPRRPTRCADRLACGLSPRPWTCRSRPSVGALKSSLSSVSAGRSGVA